MVGHQNSGDSSSSVERVVEDDTHAEEAVLGDKLRTETEHEIPDETVPEVALPPEQLMQDSRLHEEAEQATTEHEQQLVSHDYLLQDELASKEILQGASLRDQQQEEREHLTESLNELQEDAKQEYETMAQQLPVQQPALQNPTETLSPENESQDLKTINNQDIGNKGDLGFVARDEVDSLPSDTDKIKNKQKNKKKRPKSATQSSGERPKLLYTSTRQNEPKDCYDHYLQGRKKDGTYKIHPIGINKQFSVYCDMKNGGWTVIQRRVDGTIDFFKNWAQYKEGFGTVFNEHWLGNQLIHRLTNQDHYSLRVDLMDWDRQKRQGHYDYFMVASEGDMYRLWVDGYTGDAGDGMTKHHGLAFSTHDKDNDQVVKEFGGSCAKRFHGAWWFYKCYTSNLNGKYYREDGVIPEKLHDGVTWKPWTGSNYSLKKVEMKIRPARVNT